MSLGPAFDLGVAALIVVMAAVATFARRTEKAVVALLLVGLLLAIAWLRLGAADVALTEAAVGTGLTGLLLLGVVCGGSSSQRGDLAPRRPEGASGMALWRRTRGLGPTLAVALCCVLVTTGLIATVLTLPLPGPSLTSQVAAALPRTEVENPVTATLLAFRALDTLLEKIVLVLALLAVWSVGTDQAWGGRPRVVGVVFPDPIRLLARVLPTVGIMLAGFLLWNGATHAGGAFPAATILAVMWLLVVIAGLAKLPPTSHPALRGAIAGGPLFFIVMGVVGALATGIFLGYPAGWAKVFIVLIEIPLTLAVAAMLALLMTGSPMNSVGAPAAGESSS